MRITVVGGTGTIGTAVVELLSARHDVVVAARQSGDVTVDISSGDSVRSMYDRVGTFDALACAAGEAHFRPLRDPHGTRSRARHPQQAARADAPLEAAARVLAVREAAHGILTNVVQPGFTLTEPARTNPDLEEAMRVESSRTPTGRLCTPDDVASAVVYLGSTANSHVNGQIISVAGGRELVR